MTLTARLKTSAAATFQTGARTLLGLAFATVLAGVPLQAAAQNAPSNETPIAAPAAPLDAVESTAAKDLIGVWAADESAAEGMTIIGQGYAIFLVVNDSQRPFAGETPTEDEMAQAYQSAVSASLKFDVIEPGRWRMEYINSTNPALKGLSLEYDYEWLNAEKTSLRYWALDAAGERTAETGVSNRVQ